MLSSGDQTKDILRKTYFILSIKIFFKSKEQFF